MMLNIVNTPSSTVTMFLCVIHAPPFFSDVMFPSLLLCTFPTVLCANLFPTFIIFHQSVPCLLLFLQVIRGPVESVSLPSGHMLHITSIYFGRNWGFLSGLETGAKNQHRSVVLHGDSSCYLSMHVYSCSVHSF